MKKTQHSLIENQGEPIIVRTKSPLQLAAEYLKAREERTGDKLNFDAGQVLENQIWVGSLVAARDIHTMGKLGITSVLTTARGLDVTLPKELFRHKVILMEDHPAEDLLGKLPEALEFLTEELAQGRKVLVHCASGISRSVSVCMAYLMKAKNFTFKAAMEQIRADRPFVNPNAGFRLQLSELEACTGDIVTARESYTRKLKGRPVTESLIQWRNQANELHRKMDDLENKIQSSRSYGEKEIDREDSIQNIIRQAERLLPSAEPDRVAVMMINSVISKGSRLIGLLLST